MSDSPHEPTPEIATIDKLFERALSLEGSARADYLATLSASDHRAVVGLLARVGENPLENLVSTVRLATEAESGHGNSISTAGRWKLQHQLGSGGMGQVFYARRDEQGYVQHAAVKVLWAYQADSDFKGRFLRERRILASLEHPGLARFLDGGLLADSRPWFAMEFVSGIDVVSYAADLSVPEKLKLFEQICETLEYAHQRLIIHRDIKPQNILIDESGKPKLLDFGIASVLDGVDDGIHTRTGGSLLTLKYASPEQVSGGVVAVASDIYQLGLLLYQMLTNTLPYDVEDMPLRAAVRAICEQPSPAPSARVSAIHADLDAIVLRALDKDPSRRYTSVAAFAQDIKDHLAGRPVTARAHSRLYVASRFVRRNAALVGVSAAAALGLAVATAVSIHLAIDARAEAERARKSQQILADVLQYTDPFTGSGTDVALSAALLSALPGIDEQVKDDPRLAWDVYATLADIFGGLGMLEKETEYFEKALLAADRLGSDNERERMRAVAGLGNTIVRTDPAAAVLFFSEQLPARPATQASAAPWLSATYAKINALTRLRNFQQADAETENMARVAAEFESIEPRTNGRLSQLLAGKARREGDLAAADRHWSDAVTYMQQAGNPFAYAVTLSNQAIHFGRSGRFPDSEETFKKSIAVFAERAPSDPTYANVLRSYAGLLFRDQRQREALNALNQSLDILNTAGGEHGYSRYVTLVNLATYAFSVGEIEQSLAASGDALDLALAEFGGDSELTSRILIVIARLYQFAGRGDVALAIMEKITAGQEIADEYLLALGQTQVDAGLVSDAQATLQRLGFPDSDDAKRIRVQIHCVTEPVGTLSPALAPPRDATGDPARHLRIWRALVTASSSPEPGNDLSLQKIAGVYSSNRHAFFDVLDQRRALSAMTSLAAQRGGALPDDLQRRFDELSALTDKASSLVSVGGFVRVRDSLATLGITYSDVGASPASVCPKTK